MDKYRRIPVNTFEHIAINGGVLAYDFDPATGTIQESALMGPTSGGVSFSASHSFIDFGEDIDNCPKNTKELMRHDDWDIKASGSFVTADPVLAKRLIGTADVSTTNGVSKVTPRDSLDITNDFFGFWIIGDYGAKNTGNGAGFIAIHIKDALSTGGFQLQTEDKNKWKFAFEFTAHYSLDAQDTVPFDVYTHEGTDAPGISIRPRNINIAVDGSATITATTYPANATVTWTSNDEDVATVDDGEVTAVAAGHCLIVASITDNGTTYEEICVVTVTPAAE